MLIDRIKKQLLIKVVGIRRLPSGVFVATLLLVVGSCSSAGDNSLNKVVSVIDGDTLVMLNGEKVRLLGINAPELGYNGALNDAGALAARQFLKTRVLNKFVVIEKDAEDKDHYGRTLAHVFLKSGEHINRDLLRHGKVFLNIHPPNLRYSSQLIEAQSMAEKAGKGIWSTKLYPLLFASQIPEEQIKKWGRFSSTVKKVSVLEKGAQLWLSDKVYIWIAEKNRQFFPAVTYYRGKHIEIRGWPRKWGKFWSLNAIHPSQLLIKEQ